MNDLMRMGLVMGVMAAAVVGLDQIGRGGPPVPPGRGNANAPSEASREISRKMGMRNINVHDPSTIVKSGDEYYLYATGMPMFHSKDLFTWERGPSPVTGPLSWTAEAIGPRGRNAGAGSYWAPDVIQVHNKWFLFLSISGFGVNTSGIGVMTNTTLNPNDPAYKWQDGGLVVKSVTADDYNAIDPAAFLDDDGKLWMAFGSFWSGIKLIELNPETGRRIAPDSPMYSLAHWDSIEGCYIYKHDGKYYLFVSMGMCCRGAGSTYHMRVGRSDKVTGPYLDKEGKDMLLGGGTLFMESHIGPLIGPGHAGIVKKDGKEYLSFHVESNTAGGTLGVRPISWDKEGWPVAEDAD